MGPRADALLARLGSREGEESRGGDSNDSFSQAVTQRLLELPQEGSLESRGEASPACGKNHLGRLGSEGVQFCDPPD